MMRLFKKKKVEPEKRSYTDSLTAALLAAASGGNVEDPAVIGALETAAGAYSRAFLTAEVDGTDIVSRHMLADWARQLIRSGQALSLISVSDDGQIELLRAHGCDITGGPSPATWRYRLDLPGPSRAESKRATYDMVVHLRYATDPATPWKGIGPLQFASATGTLARALEDYFGSEAAAPHGHILPVPQTSTENRDRLMADLKVLKGRTSVTETTRDAYGAGPAGAPTHDYKPSRIGPNPPQSLAVVHQHMFDVVLAVCGYPADLTADRGASGQRESWRRFLHGSAQPLADLIAEELSEKLERPITIGLDRLFASDIHGRARAFQSMTGGGMSEETAARLAGLVPATSQ